MASKFSSADLPDVLPIFPLPGALLLPRANLPLNLFEPRYLAMLEDVLKTPGRLIGMIQPTSTPHGMPAGKLHHIGCAGRVVGFRETEDGRYLITLSGASRFRLAEEETGFTPYMRARVDWSGFEADLKRPEPDHEFDRPEFLRLLERFFVKSDLRSDWETLKDADEELLVNSLSILCPFPHEDKQMLLEAPTLQNRRETLVSLMEFLLRGPSEGPIQ